MRSKNFENNRKHMAKHPSQGAFKKVLCVCSGGLLRSPTAAWVLSNKPYSFNTRSAGCVQKYAVIPVDELLVHWADEIVCMDKKHYGIMQKRFGDIKPMVCLNISDDFEYRELALVDLIKERYVP